MAISAGTFTFVADLVHRRSGIQLKVGKEYLVEDRLLPLARDAGLDGVDEYVHVLRNVPHRAEHDQVVEALTTNETSWFRDFTPFQTLTEHVLPVLVRERHTLTGLRVWSAGCATGQEPYSIVMALLQADPALPVEITATDISREALGRARAGRYNQVEVNRGLPVAMLVRHFVRVGTEWEVSEAVRSKVTFSRHNLLTLPPGGGPSTSSSCVTCSSTSTRRQGGRCCAGCEPFCGAAAIFSSGPQSRLLVWRTRGNECRPGAAPSTGPSQGGQHESAGD
jgi:chemotaxis protein methyltransferase CheR